MSEMHDPSVLERLDAVKDAMSVSRAFGESYHVEGITIIPVAVVRGGGGGGGGSGTARDGTSGEKGTGSGAGLGYGAVVRPIGVIAVKDGKVSWQPTIDVMRIILGGQLLGLAAILTIRRLLGRR
jgi:uncharacterized spore protein YtfJ